MEVLKEISEWVSISEFKADSVPDDSLERLISAARRAPSAKNRQPWRMIVVRDPAVREKIYEASYRQEHVGQAPVIIAACTTNVDYRMPNGQLAYPIDIGIALSFLMVQSRAEGLGAHMITTFDEREVKDLLSVPYQMRVVALLLVGFPASVPMQSERRPLNQLVSYDHW
ncbi:MAG TPA: nitroreductase [Sediminispirochaeta sp.]|nr:nitroreductase [Sediminispirochaeta sp.]